MCRCAVTFSFILVRSRLCLIRRIRLCDEPKRAQCHISKPPRHQSPETQPSDLVGLEPIWTVLDCTGLELDY